MNVLSLFDGMSCGQIALQRANYQVDKYYASEIDSHAIKVTQHNFPNTIQLGDIISLKGSDLPKIDLIIGGSPCQDLSGLKNGEGLKGEKSKLLFEYKRLLDEVKPKYFLLENVVPRKPQWKAEIDNIFGVKGVLINSDLFIDQNRPRVYWTNIPIASLPQRPKWGRKYFQYRRTYFRENKNGVCPCLTANMGTGGHNVPLKSIDLKDKLTPEECERLQTLPIGYTSIESNSQRYKMIGNGWTVDVIVHLFSSLNVNKNAQANI